MNILKTIKTMGLALLVVSFAVGCASAPEEQPAEPAPAPEVKPAEPAPAPVADTSSYQVVSGDNLWDISGKSSVYGNPYQWPLIYKANSNQIKDADLIFPGQNLTIDNNPSSSDVSAAVQHAKTRGSWSIGATEASDTAYLGQ